MPIKDSSSEVSNSKHPVPQNVMDVEFKVVGDLTVRQILYVLVGVSLIYILTKASLPEFWRWIFIFVTGAITIGVAFVPIQERGLDKWITIFINAMMSPTQMTWKKMPSPPAYFLADYAQIIKNEIITLTPIKNRTKLDDYLSKIDDGMSELEIEERQKLDAISQNFNHSTDSGLVSQLVSEIETVPQTLVVPTIVADELDTPMAQESEEVIPMREPEKEKEKPAPKTNLESDNKAQTPISTNIVTDRPLSTGTTDNKKILSDLAKDEMTSKLEFIAETTKSQNPILLDIQPKLKQEVDKTESNGFIEKPLNQSSPQNINRPMNIASEKADTLDAGKINLKRIAKLPPIIVAEDLKDIKEKEETLEKKVSELLEVAKKARAQYQIRTGNTLPETSHTNTFDEHAAERLDELKKEQSKIVYEITKSKAQINLLDKEAKGREKLENQIESLTEQNQLLESRLKQIQSKLDTQNNETQESTEFTGTPVVGAAGEELLTDTTNSQNTGSTAKQTPGSNIISGTIKDKNGELIEGAVVLVKDHEGNVTGALKTNSLGQFTSQTSVSNGIYLIEVIKGGQKFDIMKIDANGSILSPLYFISK